MVDDITRRRWENAKDATEIDPLSSLKVFIDDVESGRIKPINICIAYTDKNASGDIAVGLYSAGPQTTLESQGMLFRAMSLLNP